ncbi:MAG: prepilin-type N-terminal cleavage/methylation domain-containing protein [Campylobacterota bacterium]|nr:prepilin-type N-terminal cleavage/methylation domain-containing protein [Campylobacterota bacterium]
MRKAFTLIELMVSISILSIIMIYLYKSYSSLNRSNSIYKEKISQIRATQLKKKVIFLDFALAFDKSINILNQDKNEDIVFLQTSNSMHRRYNPYVAYIFKDEKLYRLESLKEFKEYPLSMDVEFSVEFFGNIDGFRVYSSTKKDSKVNLVHVNFKDEEDILLKIKIL